MPAKGCVNAAKMTRPCMQLSMTGLLCKSRKCSISFEFAAEHMYGSL